MYIQNNNSFSYASPEQGSQTYKIKEIKASFPKEVSLDHFSENALMNFNYLSFGYTQDEKNSFAQSLNAIGKAAAFSSLNGFDAQNDRNLVSQYFSNFEGVLSDAAIKKMIFSKLDNPKIQNREFLQTFANTLDTPLTGINIRV